MSREILETKNRQGLKLIERALLAAVFLAILFSFTGFAVRCEDVSQEVLRLHVLANSDSEEDQELKLQVRDRILQEGAGLLDGVKTLEEAEQVVTEALPRLTQAAQDEIFSRGYDYPVSLTLADVSFTTRQYEEITLPAGVYRALQVRIGSGEGHNWWCVMFPSLCLPAAEEPAKLEDVLTPEELEIVEGGSYEVRFQVLEWVEELGHMME